MAPRIFVGRVLAVRTLALFGFFTFLCVAVLGATYITSRYALKLYVQQQLDRIDWDVTLTQQHEIEKAPMLLSVLRKQPDVRKAESLVFLRAYLPEGLTARIDDEPILVPWFVVLSSTDPELLPPAYRSRAGQAVFSLFGRKDFVELNISRATGGRRFSFVAQVESPPASGVARAKQAPSAHEHRAGADHAHVHTAQKEMFSVPITDVVELDRGELNRWILEKMGTIAFVPYVGAGLNMPYDAATLVLFDGLLTAHAHEHGETDIHEEAGRYQPEINHVVRINRAGLISGWDLEGSRQRLQAVVDAIGKSLPYRANLYLRSDTLLLLDQMLRTSRLIGIVTLLLALPVIGIAWVFAANLVRFVVLNERRTIGLMRLRGLRGSTLSEVFLLAILIGGILGGASGLVIGVITPLVIYEGWGSILEVIRLQNPLVAIFFLAIGLAVALVMGGRLVRYIRTLTPREAAHRFAVPTARSSQVAFGVGPMLALAISGVTLIAWLSGASVSGRFPRLRFVEQSLNLVAISLLVYGLASLLASRRTLITALVQFLAPLTRGRLKEFAAEQTVRKANRAAGVVLVASLATTIVLAPSVASRSFTAKAVRGVKAQLAGEANFTFNTLDEANDTTLSLFERIQRLRGGVSDAERVLRQNPSVSSVDVLIRSLVQLYVPGYGYGGTPLFVLENPSSYLQHAYLEDVLGRTDGLRAILERVQQGEVAVSPAVAEFWKLSPGSEVMIGYDRQRKPVKVKVAGVITALPGAPQRAVQERDIFVAAQTDYLGYLFTSEAFIVASLDNPALRNVTALVPHMSLLVRGSEPISAQLPGTLRDARFLSDEVSRIRQDMFINLVEQNFGLYLVAGLSISLFAIGTIFIVNFIEERRTLGLLRVRGAGPRDLTGALVLQLYSPLLLGLAVGVVIGVGAGYAIALQIWNLRRIPTIIDQLRAQLALSWDMLAVALLILAVLSIFVSLLGAWTFRKTAREAIYQE